MREPRGWTPLVVKKSKAGKPGMSALDFLMAWYRTQCNGTWEHAYGVTIETLDNPGWMVMIDLTGTALEDGTMQAVSFQRSDTDWLSCKVEHKRFRGAGDSQKLPVILQTFQEWATKASQVK